MKQRLTQNGLNFIKRHEGLRLSVYSDVVGLPTIGYGHLIAPPESVEDYHGGISLLQAEQLLQIDISHAESAINRLIRVRLNGNQFTALTSFTFNLGGSALQRSTLRRKLNRGEYHAIPQELRRWIYAGGRRHQGLIRRRREEGNLFQQKP